MNSSTVIIRDLRRFSRRGATFGQRAGVATLATIVFMVVLLAHTLGSFGPGMAAGKAVLTYLMGLLVFVAGLFGVSFTADSLSQERREGTLGLVLLTPLRGMDLLLGRMVASTMVIVSCMVALTPVLAVTMLFGGVTVGELVRGTLALGNMLFLAVASGILVSSVATESRKAMTSGFFVLLLMVVGPYLLVGWFVIRSSVITFEQAWFGTVTSPIAALVYSGVFDAKAFDLSRFVISLAACQGLCWTIVAISGRALGLSIRARNNKDQGRVKSAPIVRRAVIETKGRRRIKNAPLTNQNPYGWLFGRDLLRRYYVDMFVASLCVVALISGLRFSLWNEVGILLIVFALVFFKIWVLVEVVARIFQDRQNGAFELLLTSPLGVGEISRGINRGLWAQFGRGVGVLTLGAFLLYGVQGSMKNALFRSEIVAFFWPILIVFFLDLWALKWAGVWSSLRRPSAGRALLAPLGAILVLPWILVVLAGIGIALQAFLFGTELIELTQGSVTLIWFLVCAAVSLGFGLSARASVLKRTRDLVMLGYDIDLAKALWERRPTRAKSPRWLRFVWPRHPLARLGVVLGLVLLFFTAALSIRRTYYEVQLVSRLAQSEIAQQTQTAGQRGSMNFRTTRQSEISVAVGSRVPMNLLISPELRFVEPSASIRSLSTPEQQRRDPDYFQKLLDTHTQKNAAALTALEALGERLASQSSTLTLPLATLNDFGHLHGINHLLGAEVFRHLLRSEITETLPPLLAVLRIAVGIIEEDERYFLPVSMQGIRQFQHLLATVLSSGECTEVELRIIEDAVKELEAHVLVAESCRSSIAQIESLTELGIGLRGVQSNPDNARIYLLAMARGFTGTTAREWIEFLEMATNLFQGAKALDIDDVDGFRLQFMAAQASVDELSEDGFPRHAGRNLLQLVEQKTLLRAWLRAFQCAIEMERFKLREGNYPQELSAVGALPMDPFTGGAFDYSRLESGFELRFGPSWMAGSQATWRVTAIDSILGGER